MDFTQQILANRRALIDDLFRRVEAALWPFAHAADEFFATLFEKRLPADWREQWHAFIADQASSGYVVESESVRELEEWIESWARYWKLLPEETDKRSASEPAASPPGTGDPFLDLVNQQAVETWMPRGIGNLTTSSDQLPERAWRAMEESPEVVDVKVRKGVGAWYDEAVTSGQYEPGFVRRVGVAVVRVLFPDSEPTTTIIYSDGTQETMLGGGPTSGALGGQAAALTGVVQAASKGKLVFEFVENLVDASFQEATGSPIGPSILRSEGRGASDHNSPKLLTYQPTSRTLNEVRSLPQPEKWQAGERYVQELYGATDPRHFPVPPGDGVSKAGGRYVDSPVDMREGGVLATEVKTYGSWRSVAGVGEQQFVELSEPIRQQVLKDAWLKKNLPSFDPRWVFLDAPPSLELRAFLKQQGIVAVTYGQ